MMRVLNIAATAALLLGPACNAFAGALEPSKPSQVVSVAGQPSSPACPNSTNTFQVNATLRPEGGNTPFAIPSKSVFVVTSFDWRVNNQTPGNRVAIAILSSGSNGELGTLALSAGEVGADGQAFGNGSPADRMIVKPPGILCAQYPIGTTDALVVVRGFFAKDK